MAHLKQLPTCMHTGCILTATHELFNRNTVSLGTFCSRHAATHLNAQREIEKEQDAQK